ncbi:oxygenase MpaB family protein [Burkholderia gladioli]|uniref:oxygenase MpaB family protein n=1 Tax=Burkholderia gladioli TaxID=28095 RepID=UPI001641D8D1|nr:oxygenase MpaB family protein [Burkholderia gladioli]
MSTDGPTISVNKVVTKKRLYGKESRWRRNGAPQPGSSSTDFGVFGPGSVAWEVLLHPASIVFQTSSQGLLQLTYKPILAGVRDWDPLSKKARNGTLTIFDYFDRLQRNSGIHAPMWLGDRDTAQRVAKHLGNIHAKVAADVIDSGAPELGGYAANSPRESMWAALTEMHSMLWIYESLAYKGFRRIGRLPANLRDQFISEVSEYCRLFPARDEQLPRTMEDLKALYKRDEKLFGTSPTMPIIPETGQNFWELLHETVKKNDHPSQWRVKLQLFFQNKVFAIPVQAAASHRTRQNMGMSPKQEAKVLARAKRMRPLIWLLQRRPIANYFMRIMWGPDGARLIESARKLHEDAKKEKGFRFASPT